jgi:Arylsulfotransferase (ASST)/Secretion system C-terminal sorting domain
MKKNLLALMLIFTQIMYSQNSGLLSLSKSDVFEGYTMFYPNNQNTVYLINNCGEVVHKWTDAPTSRPGNAVYLLPNGTLLKTRRPAAVNADTIWAGGGGATIEIVDWDNKPSWSYNLNNGKARLHHDIKMMPNGNILAIAWERLTADQAIALGRDPAKISQNSVWPDYIIEIDPKINSGNPVVWEWHAKDHFIQDFDSTKANYGNVVEHPELIDFNFDTSNGAADWMHSNALDYNPTLDHILLSVPTFHELWIIDHSTTTAQAADHKGGKSNKGGDLIYRVGNPAAYKRGTAQDQTLFYPHDCHWVQDLPIGHPDYGKIMVFNNQISTTYSTIEKFGAPWSMYDLAYDKLNGVWLPSKFTNTITHPGPRSFVSSGLSSSQILPNNNLLIFSGRQGYITEMTPLKKIVWEYIIPLKAGKPIATTESLLDNDNVTFRAYKYSKDYTGLAGRILNPIGFIETNPDATLCDKLSSTENEENGAVNVYPNPVDQLLTIEGYVGSKGNIEIIDAFGRMVINTDLESGNTIDVSKLSQGLYLLRIDQKSHVKFTKF